MKKARIGLLKLFAIIVVLLGTCGILFAAPVSMEEAEEIARNHAYQAFNQLNRVFMDKADINVAHIFEASRDMEKVYYIFNLDPEGWVIVAADDVAYPIIAYSNTGAYAEDNQPPAFEAWMENVKDEIYDALVKQSNPLPAATSAWEGYTDGSDIFPLSIVVDKLIQTTWSQGGKPSFDWPWYPSYDEQMPSETNWAGFYRVSPTGCGATAMAQIINYWSWPPSGKGSHSYDPPWDCESQGNTCHGYGVRSVDFSAQSYNWDIMPTSVAARIRGTHTAGEQQVQILMKDVGIALEMDYTPWVSGAYPSDVAPAFINYYRYDPGAHRSSKSSYPTTWISKLRNELDNSRPLYYYGYNSGGHAFICDGYDSNNSFHFNWGWGGSYDGWYYLDALTPGSHDYTSSQGAVFNIKPARPDLVITSVSTSPANIGPGQTVNIQVNVKNQGPDAASAFKVDWYADRTSVPGLSTSPDASALITSLDAGATVSANMTYSGYADTGAKQMYAWVNRPFIPFAYEWNSDNNLMGPQALNIVAFCNGNFDLDTDVDGSDLATFAADFGRTNCDVGPVCEGDFDGDDDVDGSDLALFAASFGRTNCP